MTTQQAAAIASAMIETPSAANLALSPTHAKFLPAAEIADELAKLDASGYSDAVKLAVRFTALTAKRLCEVRRAVWDEIDLEAKIWKIPGRS